MPEDRREAGALAEALRAFVRGELRLPAEKLKENLMRTVWKVATPTHGWVLVKHYRYVRAFDRARYLIPVPYTHLTLPTTHPVSISLVAV